MKFTLNIDDVQYQKIVDTFAAGYKWYSTATSPFGMVVVNPETKEQLFRRVIIRLVKDEYARLASDAVVEDAKKAISTDINVT